MQWEMILLLHLAAPFVLYYLIRDRIEGFKRKIVQARSRS
jgi:hypothetical protein